MQDGEHLSVVGPGASQGQPGLCGEVGEPFNRVFVGVLRDNVLLGVEPEGLIADRDALVALADQGDSNAIELVVVDRMMLKLVKIEVAVDGPLEGLA